MFEEVVDFLVDVLRFEFTDVDGLWVRILVDAGLRLDVDVLLAGGFSLTSLGLGVRGATLHVRGRLLVEVLTLRFVLSGHLGGDVLLPFFFGISLFLGEASFFFCSEFGFLLCFLSGSFFSFTSSDLFRLTISFFLGLTDLFHGLAVSFLLRLAICQLLGKAFVLETLHFLTSLLFLGSLNSFLSQSLFFAFFGFLFHTLSLGEGHRLDLVVLFLAGGCTILSTVEVHVLGVVSGGALLARQLLGRLNRGVGLAELVLLVVVAHVLAVTRH